MQDTFFTNKQLYNMFMFIEIFKKAKKVPIKISMG